MSKRLYKCIKVVSRLNERRSIPLRQNIIKVIFLKEKKTKLKVFASEIIPFFFTKLEEIQ